MTGLTKIGAATQILRGIGAPVNNKTVGAMVGWFNAEGGNWNNSASFNPLNTTLTTPGARSVNSVGVKAYPDWSTGISATVQTLRQSNMSGIVQAFKSSDPQAVIHAIGSSPWGTSGSLAAQTISSAVGQKYSLPNATSISAAMASPTSTVTTSAPTTSTDTRGAIVAALMNEANKPISSTGSVPKTDPVGDAAYLVGTGAYTTNTPAKTTTVSASSATTSAGKRAVQVHDLGSLQGLKVGAGVDISKGDTVQISQRLASLGRKLGVTIYAISAYRTPAHSVAVGGFADDPHTKGRAIDIGVNGALRASAAQLTNAQLASVGLWRPFDQDGSNPNEVNHIELIGQH